MRFILVFLLFVAPAFACMNGIPLSEAVKAVALEAGAGAVTCEASPEEQCLCYDEIGFQYADIVDREVLDYVAKENIQVCASQEACDTQFAALVCDSGSTPIKNYDLLEVYCAREIMKIDGKKLVNNPTKKTAYEAAEAARVALAAAMVQAEKAQVCGKSAMALVLVRNASKGLSTAQVKDMVAAYASVKNLLDTGSLTSAIEEINSITPDGTLITSADKEAIVAHINGCKP